MHPDLTLAWVQIHDVVSVIGWRLWGLFVVGWQPVFMRKGSTIQVKTAPSEDDVLDSGKRTLSAAEVRQAHNACRRPEAPCVYQGSSFPSCNAMYAVTMCAGV